MTRQDKTRTNARTANVLPKIGQDGGQGNYKNMSLDMTDIDMECGISSRNVIAWVHISINDPPTFPAIRRPTEKCQGFLLARCQRLEAALKRRTR